MSFCLNFPLFAVVMCLSSSVISSALSHKNARRVSVVLCLAVTLMNAAVLAYTVSTGTETEYLMGHYPHPWGNELRIGPAEALAASVFSAVLLLICLGGDNSISGHTDERKRHFWYVMADLILASLNVLVYTNDIFTGYVFVEISTLSSCGILMIRENGKSLLACTRYLIFSLVGSGLFLLGVIFLYGITGHLLMPELNETLNALWESGQYRVPLLTAVCLITIGLSVKSGLFPFHLWMSDTYGAASAASSGILSGLISKGYIFLLIKIIRDVFGTRVFYSSGMQNVLLGLGMAGIILGSVEAIRENNIFRMLAYSSAAQIGYIYMGLGLSPALGTAAALYHIFTHALTKPLLFMSASELSDASGGGTKFRNLQGAGYAAFPAGIFFTFGSLSMIGIPVTAGFISKYMFGAAAFESIHEKMIPVIIVLAVSTVLNTLYFARTVIRIYSRRSGALAELPAFRSGPRFTLSCSVLCVLNLALGICAGPVISLLTEALSLF